MKYTREFKVGVLAVISACVLYFGFHFLKGVNVFSPVKSYYGIYATVNGLTEQAPVYVRGYKVGQVDHISYDFTREKAFMVHISVEKSIMLPQETQMILVSDGLLGGKAISLNIPCGNAQSYYETGAELPTCIENGLIEDLEQNIMAKLGVTIQNIDSLVVTINEQLSDSNLYQSLSHINRLTADLEHSAQDIRGITKQQLPNLISSADSMMQNIDAVAQDIQQANLPVTVQKVDDAVDALSEALKDENSTLGLLLHDNKLYNTITETIVSADSLIVDLKQHPKRYVHFSLFGKKEK
ncbi:MAG: MlaD family protein [Paludibacteraceae bacterium]|nr:MCE family protein [Candidatus Colicola coprequi]MCQ2333297.1 MlaD family protein [Paludibacteraceae bacterium]